MALAAPRSMPWRSRSAWVANRSSPINWTDPPSRAVKRGPAGPVVLGQTILDRDDRILLDPVLEQRDHPRRCRAPRRRCGQVIGAGLGVVEVAGRDVERDAEVAADLEAAGQAVSRM